MDGIMIHSAEEHKFQLFMEARKSVQRLVAQLKKDREFIKRQCACTCTAEADCDKCALLESINETLGKEDSTEVGGYQAGIVVKVEKR